jgi:hypothetical protein
MTQALRDKLAPDADGLLALLAEQVDDSMLDEIADADRGDGFDLHRAALTAIRDERKVPVPLRFEPMEVLTLTRWSEPDDSRWRTSDASARRGHVMRAFCCTVLLRERAEVACGFDECETDTLAQLLASLTVLREPFQEAGLRFLVWCFTQLGTKIEERPFYVFAILLLCLQVRRDLAPREIAELVATLYEEEEAVRSGGWAYPPAESNEWLLGLLWAQRHEVWRALGRELPRLAQTIGDEGVRRSLAEVAARLAS